MKYILTLVSVILFCSFYLPDDEIYSISFATAEGKRVDLSDFKGKKMLFVILPITDADTMISFNELSTLQKKYDKTLALIGIPSGDENVSMDARSKIKNLSRDKKLTFIVTEGMRVKKSNGITQMALFQWLTNRDRNKHFDQDVLGPGHKFFVDELGVLYAVIGPKIKLSHPVIEKILTRPLQKAVNKK